MILFMVDEMNLTPLPTIIKTQEKITAKNIRQAIVVLTDYAKYV
jgi:hypothetical protein